MLITPPALHVLLLFLSHFSFFSLLRRPSSLLRVSSSLRIFTLSFFLYFSPPAYRLPPCDATACNGLKGLHSNNRETNCRALARYRARPVGRSKLAARDQHQRSYITVAFVTVTCLCFRLVFAILLHRSLLRLSTDSETSSANGILSRNKSWTLLFETRLITYYSLRLSRNESKSILITLILFCPKV